MDKKKHNYQMHRLGAWAKRLWRFASYKVIRSRICAFILIDLWFTLSFEKKIKLIKTFNHDAYIWAFITHKHHHRLMNWFTNLNAILLKIDVLFRANDKFVVAFCLIVPLGSLREIYIWFYNKSHTHTDCVYYLIM